MNSRRWRTSSYHDYLDREAESNAAEQRERRREEMHYGLDEATIEAAKLWNLTEEGDDDRQID